MQRKHPQKLGDLLSQIIDEDPQWAQELYKQRAIDFFWERFGTMRPFIRDISFRQNTLHIQMRSSTAARMIAAQKDSIMHLINDHLHYLVVEDIRIYWWPTLETSTRIVLLRSTGSGLMLLRDLHRKILIHLSLGVIFLRSILPKVPISISNDDGLLVFCCALRKDFLPLPCVGEKEKWRTLFGTTSV